jgi:hypothetical protein
MILTRETVLQKIEDLLQGQLNAKELASWAFDQTYAYELDQLAYEAGAEDLLDEVLDELIFHDDPTFQLEAEELRQLQQLLREPPPEADDQSHED